MAGEYLNEVLAFIRATANTPQGIKKIAREIVKNLDATDADIQDLVGQRKSLGNLLGQYVDLYRAFSGEQLMEPRELMVKRLMTSGVKAEDEYRALVLEAAQAEYAKPSRGSLFVTDEEILSRLLTEGRELPWRNPKAVIATILYRSKLWEKIKSGTFKKIENGKEDN